MEQFIGDCAVCYIQLLPRANHAFTECGHLFCIKCLLTWHEQSSTCPMCREKLYVKDDAYDDSYDGYTDDSGDDGRFDTIDDYLVEEIEWSKIIEEDDLQLQISQENLSQIRNMRKRILDLLILQAYTDEYIGEISIIFINRTDYNNIHVNVPNYYYEIVLKPRDSGDNETHYFGHIIEIKMCNVPFGEYPSGAVRYTLEHAFIIDYIDHAEVYQQTQVLFRDIRRLYSFRPLVSVD
jgi:hypothetical protein